MDRRKPELLSPAGDMEKLRMAVAYGADAVYLAGTSFGMRSFTGNFTPDELPKAVQLAHAAGVKVHCTVNIMPRNDEAAALPAYLEQLDAACVDALILADLGAFTLAGKYAPRCERHISTQQSIANYVCAQSWFDLGARRVVLARELSLQEILTIRERVSPELELGHGAGQAGVDQGRADVPRRAQLQPERQDAILQRLDRAGIAGSEGQGKRFVRRALQIGLEQGGGVGLRRDFLRAQYTGLRVAAVFAAVVELHLGLGGPAHRRGGRAAAERERREQQREQAELFPVFTHRRHPPLRSRSWGRSR